MKSIPCSCYKCVVHTNNKKIKFEKATKRLAIEFWKKHGAAIFKTPSSPLYQLRISSGVHLTPQYNQSRLA